MIDRPPRRTGSARDNAEAAFKAATTAKPATPVVVPKREAGIPSAKELVSIRIDRNVLEHFQADGPGWQERINTALRKATGL
ncbi:MAG: hypothetical protein JWR08_2329 [Enterovirga sp.]|nr:hypothetical protein [Enterovirga sp.]